MPHSQVFHHWCDIQHLYHELILLMQLSLLATHPCRFFYYILYLYCSNMIDFTDCFPFTGKSSLCIQFVDGQFVDSYAPTIENTFTKNLRVSIGFDGIYKDFFFPLLFFFNEVFLTRHLWKWNAFTPYPCPFRCKIMMNCDGFKQEIM